jgi:hypothetical protein
VTRVLVRCDCVVTETDGERSPSYLSLLKEQDRARALVWEGKWRVHRASYRQYGRKLVQLRLLKMACESGGISVFWTEPYGSQWAAPSWGLGSSNCEAIPEEIRDTELTLKRLQTQASEDARRLRIHPGLARFE